MLFDLERVRKNVQEASTEDLLDRATVYRAGMEPAALELIEEELKARGIDAAEIEEHGERRRPQVKYLPDGTAVRCSFCYRPAVGEGWDWHRLWGKIPLFPRFYCYCEEHLPSDLAGPRNATSEDSPPLPE
jgi:hypothetical protein